jgi:predicted DNA-binding ribbon-helix-helix protein
VSAVKPVKRSFSIAGHRTSISLEAPFWQALHELADEAGISLAKFVAEIDSRRGRTNLSSAVRVHILEHYRRHATLKPPST